MREISPAGLPLGAERVPDRQLAGSWDFTPTTAMNLILPTTSETARGTYASDGIKPFLKPDFGLMKP